MKARLASYKNGELAASYPLPEPGTTIGRDEDNHVRCNHPRVSRHHAAIRAKDDMWVIEDLDSTNGLLVNGARVKHAVLKKGDAIGVGPFEFVFETIADGEAWTPARRAEPASEARRPTLAERREAGGPKTLPSEPK